MTPVGPERSGRSAGRRWLRRLLVGGAALFALALGVFVWAWLSTDSSTIARALVWMEADVGDQDRFPARLVPAGEYSSPLASGPEAELTVAGPVGEDAEPLDDALSGTDTRAFVVVHDDHVVYDRYYDGADQDHRETSFSVAKSLVSALIGIAIDEGAIGDVDDRLTDYVPELVNRDPRFTQITLADLLTMSSGLRYEESSFPFPWGDDTTTYYGVDLREAALDETDVEQPPGQSWHYNNYNPLLLGLVLERATDMSVSEYTARRLWEPMGAADDASWSLDSEDSGFEKMESGFNATARDYARFGLLFLHGGRWNGRQVIPRTWVRASTHVQTATDFENPYGYFWWIDGEAAHRFYAFGNYGQYIYVAPDADTVIVRIGSDWGFDNRGWLGLFRDIADDLGPLSDAAPRTIR
jgi:CubicO group peptidase (beta-lactamase class C family)